MVQDNEAEKQTGIEWCIQQSKEIIEAGIPIVHYYSMGKSDTVKRVEKEVFKKKRI